MMVLEHKLAFDLEVAGEAGPRISSQNLSFITAALDVQTAWAMAGLTAFNLNGIIVF